MIKWIPITDYKLLDWGVVPADAFLFRHIKSPAVFEYKRVLYCNLPKPIKCNSKDSFTDYFPLKFNTSMTKNMSWDYDVYGDEYASSTYYIRSTFRFELYESQLDIVNLTVGNVPDGTGTQISPSYAEIVSQWQGDSGMTNTRIRVSSEKNFCQISSVPEDKTYYAMKMYIYNYHDTFSSELKCKIKADSISQLHPHLLGYV